MFGEIRIDKMIGSRPVPRRRRDGTLEVSGDVVSAAELCSRIDAFEAQGMRALLLVFDWADGGEVEESMALYGRLRRFSDSGGKVVVFVKGYIASSAPAIAAAGDVVVMDDHARLLFHVATAGEEPSLAVTRRLLPWFAARCMTPEPELWEWLQAGAPGTSHSVTMLDAEGAWAHGWCDMLGTLESARALAAMAGEGQPLPRTPRAEMLAAKSRAPLPALSATGARAALKTSDYAEDATGAITTGAVMVANTLVTIARTAATAYVVGDLRTSNGGKYRCVQAGTSANASNPTYAPGTSYALGALVNYGTPAHRFYSLTGSNIGHTPTVGADTAYWRWEGPIAGPSGFVLNQPDGTARWTSYAPLRASPDGLQIGNRILSQHWFANTFTVAGAISCSSAGVLSTPWKHNIGSVSWQQITASGSGWSNPWGIVVLYSNVPALSNFNIIPTVTGAIGASPSEAARQSAPLIYTYSSAGCTILFANPAGGLYDLHTGWNFSLTLQAIGYNLDETGIF
jgi:hypothetical protein